MASLAQPPDAAPEPVLERILDSMDDGVLVVDPGGTIVTCNAAASRVLGLDDGALPVGAGFGETFLLLEGLDTFTQAVLDAVWGDGEPRRAVVDISVGGEPRSIVLATTYLRGGARGGRRGVAVVAVFGDITEVAALREAEVRLGRKVEAQLAELSQAYRAIEERNARLAATMRRARVARRAAAAAVVAVVATIGAWAWRSDAVVADLLSPEPAAAAAGAAEGAVWTVAAGRFQRTASVVGRIEPGRVSRVLSPAAGSVRALRFRYGQRVEKGAALVELDLSETRREYRAARSEFLELRQRVERLAGWEDGREMAEARRRVARAGDALARQRRDVAQAAYLLERGVVAAAEHDAAVEALARLEDDLADAERELDATRDEADATARERADLEYRNRREELADLEALLRAATVRAPASGSVMEALPAAAAGAPEDGRRAGERLAEGLFVEDGQALVEIADIENLSVAAAIEEVEIARLRVGQRVRVTGDAFPGMELGGELIEVAPHARARPDGAKGGPVFPVRALLDKLAPERRRALRIGMSADVHILVRDDPDVVAVPLEAVERSGDGLAARVLDPETGEARLVPVSAGETTLDSVEIVAGLEPGDRVLLSSR